MSELVKTITYDLIEKYGNMDREVIVDITKGKFRNFKGEMLNYNEANKTGTILIQISEHMSLIRNLELGTDFEFKSNNKLQYYKLDKVDLDIEDIVILILEYFYLQAPLLYQVMSKTAPKFEYNTEIFPPYLFTDSILLSNRKTYQLYFEAGYLVVFQTLKTKDTEKQVKIFEYEVNEELYAKSIEYDNLRHNTIKNINMVFFNENFESIDIVLKKCDRYLKLITKGYINEVTKLISLINQEDT